MSAASEALTAGAVARSPEANRWLATVAAMLGMTTPIMASTMANVAIADIIGAYGIGQDRVHWLQTGFLAATTICMLLNAWFVHNFGTRNTYIFAGAMFVAGSVLGQFAPSFEWIVVARVMQGICAGLLQPLSLQVIFTLFPPAERGKALGLFGFGTMMGPALGPLYGGIMIDAFDWRFVFTGAVPFMVLGAVIGARYLPGKRADAPQARLNWTSLGLVTGMIVGFLNGITIVQREGWNDITGLSMLLAAGLLMIAFIEYECRTRTPMLNVRLFTVRSFAVVSLISVVFGMGMFGSFYLMPIFLRTVQSFTGTKAGLLLLYADTVTIFVFPVAGWIAQRVNPVYPVTGGAFLFCLSSLGLSQIQVDTSFTALVAWTMLGRVGFGIALPSLTAAGLKGLDRDLLPYGAGTMNFIRMLGGALGVNALAIILDNRTAHYAAQMAVTQVDTTGATGQLLGSVTGVLAREGVSTFERVPYAMIYLEDVIVARASALSFQDGYLALAVAFGVATLCALSLVGVRRESG